MTVTTDTTPAITRGGLGVPGPANRAERRRAARAARAADQPDDARRVDEARDFVSRFWAAPSDEALDFFMLWALGTHCTDLDNRLVFEAFCRLFLASKGPASGKSTALHMLELLCARPEMVADPTAPALLGLIEQERASLLIDEIDTLTGSGAFGRSTRTILLAGYDSKGSVTRGQGNGPVRRVCVYAPVAYAGMYQNMMSNPKLAALRTRHVVIVCKPRRPDQEVEPYRHRLYGRFARTFNDAFAKWGRRNAALLADAWPTLPDDIEDRDAQLVEPILAIADALGGTWPERARTAVRALLRGETDDDGEDEPTTPAEFLLDDLGRIFVEDRLATRTIVERLQALPRSPWTRYPSPQAAGKEIAAILEPMGIAPRACRIGELVVKGYDRADLEAVGMVVTADQAPDDAVELDGDLQF